MCRCCVFCWQVFLKYFHVEELNNAVSKFARHVASCQKYVRAFITQRRYVSMKQMAKKCEEDVKQLNDVVKQLTDYLKTAQKQLQDEDGRRHQEEKLRVEEENRKEEAKRIVCIRIGHYGAIQMLYYYYYYRAEENRKLAEEWQKPESNMV